MKKVVKFTVPGTIYVRKFDDGSEATDVVTSEQKRLRVDVGTLATMAKNVGAGSIIEVEAEIHGEKPYPRRDGTSGTRLLATVDWTTAKATPVPPFLRAEPRVVTTEVGAAKNDDGATAASAAEAALAGGV